MARVWINLDGECGALSDRIIRDRDTLASDISNADVVIPETLVCPESLVREINAGAIYARPKWFLTKFLDGRFLPQILVGIPLYGRGAEDRTGQNLSGCILGYVDMNDSTLVQDTLERAQECLSGYCGPVSFLYNGRDLCGISLGIPAYGLYAVIEGLKTKLSDFLQCPQSLKESWVCALAFGGSGVPVLNGEIRKHCFLFHKAQPFLGIVTAWDSDNVDSCIGRAYRTLHNIKVPDRHFFLGARRYVHSILQPLLLSGVFELRVGSSGVLKDVGFESFNQPTALY